MTWMDLPAGLRMWICVVGTSIIVTNLYIAYLVGKVTAWIGYDIKERSKRHGKTD